MPSAQNSRFLDLYEVAEILGISYGGAYKLVRAKKLRALHVGRMLRVERVELEAFIKDNTDESPVLSAKRRA